jgi:thiazole synthase
MSQICNVAPDVLIIGGGVIGLAIALELRLRGLTVTVLSREFAEAASQAAAGMLAPGAEQLSSGPMLELCLRSRKLYPEWIQKLEQLTGQDTGYWDCGILAPVYVALESSAPALGSPRCWLDCASIHQHQPGLSSEVVGGWWYPEDGQVENRALALSLRSAGQLLGINLQEGVAATEIETDRGQVVRVRSSHGDHQAGHYILATGAWSEALLPIPVHPKKGQMLAVQTPAREPLLLQTVLYGSEIYIVPRRDGRIVIGATSEDVGFTPENTPAGVQSLLARAMRLFPRLQNLPLQELWWGFRPSTADELPILGASPYANLTLATGHYRNGILLTPITAALIADRILNQSNDPLLNAFHWSRFSLT